jgi:hypothetical protein
MECNEARPLLDLLFDGALETKDSALMLDHLKSCSACQFEWNSLEQLRSRFKDAKNKTKIPPGLMERISKDLRHEEGSEYQRSFRRYAAAFSALALAASFVLSVILMAPWFHRGESKLPPGQIAQIDSVVNDALSQQSLIEVTDRSELAKQVGFELKYVRLPDWQMDKSSIYKPPTKSPMARFDFIRKGPSGYEHLTCYQARSGVICQPPAACLENVQGKRVLFGNRAQLQFALWSQNGRDYLFITTLTRAQLEEIVRQA